MFLITGILIALLLALVVAYVWHIRQAYNFFINLNIPGPPPTFFFGNLLDMVGKKRACISLKQWGEKYGKIFGYFEGHKPILAISDPDILQDIYIKSFSNFHSRRPFPLQDQEAKEMHLFAVTGYRWRRMRYVINPTFTTLKLKQMTPLVHRGIHIFMMKMAEQYEKGEPFDILPYFLRSTMDSLWSCAFGLDTDVQNNDNDPYLVQSRNILKPGANLKIFFVAGILLNEFKPLWQKIHRFISLRRYWLRSNIPLANRYIDEDSPTWVVKQAYKVMGQREQLGLTSRNDLMQLMLQSASDEDFIQV